MVCLSYGIIYHETDRITVWQIAVRDYKFGKGKHSSLTKATYDAVGDKFRSLWGKEAGWAHSVLFTADLRAFSERLVEKVEEQEIVKKEYNSDDPVTPKKVTVKRKREITLTPVIKEDSKVKMEEVEVEHEDMMSRVKRRRRGRA